MQVWGKSDFSRKLQEQHGERQEGSGTGGRVRRRRRASAKHIGYRWREKPGCQLTPDYPSYVASNAYRGLDSRAGLDSELQGLQRERGVPDPGRVGRFRERRTDAGNWLGQFHSVWAFLWVRRTTVGRRILYLSPSGQPN